MRDWVAGIGETTESWRGPAALGLSAAVLLWAVWYFTATPCTMARGDAGLCNSGIVARHINHQILAQCILLGLAVAAAKGGYNEIMLNRERKRTEDERRRTEDERRRAEDERRRAEDERKRADAAEARLEEERKRMDALFEEHRAERQTMVATMAQINDTLVQLLARQRNGQSSSED